MDVYPTPLLILARAPNEMYVVGGPGMMPMYVSRVEVGSLKEIWRTTLNNTDLTGKWLMPGICWLTASIAVTNGQYVYKLNGSTGDIERQVSLPTGKNPPADSAYDAMEAFKDGTMVLVTANRAPGCTVQGFSAQLKCPTDTGSFMVAVDPKTFKLLSSVQTPRVSPRSQHHCSVSR